MGLDYDGGNDHEEEFYPFCHFLNRPGWVYKESGVHVFWEPGDEIAVFTGEKAAKFTTDITAASGTATFKGTFGDATWPEDLDLWAVYPFSEDAVFDGETITTTLPSEQIAREGSFGKDMNLSIAHSNSSTLQF